MEKDSLPRSIAVITGDPSLPDPTKDGQRYGPQDLEVHARMQAAFASIEAFDTTVIERHEGLFERLADLAPDLVVNFCDTGLGNRPERELHLPARLELLDLPYTGAPPAAITLCYDKQLVRLVAEATGVAVPAERFVPAGALVEARVDAFPALIKPNTGDGSVGITRNAVVRDAREAREYIAWLAESLPGRDVLIQEYLPGPEYSLGLLGNPATGLAPLPMLEVDFSRLPDDCAPILAFESKAQPDSPYWFGIGIEPASLPPAEQAALAQSCRALFARLGLRDYARFDFRTAADGSIRLLEVNPNPAWGFDAKFAVMAGFAGWSYAEMLERLVAAAWTRVTGSDAESSRSRRA